MFSIRLYVPIVSILWVLILIFLPIINTEAAFDIADIKNDESLGDASLVSSWLANESGLMSDLVTTTGNDLIINSGTILTTGIQGNAAVFDGLDDSLYIADEDQTGLDFSNGSDMSWNYWLYKVDDGENIVISKWNHVGATQYMLVVNTAQTVGYAQIYMGINPSGYGYKNVSTPVESKYINNNQWQMITVAYDASEANIEIWIDGVSRISSNGNGIGTSIPDTDVRLKFAGSDGGRGMYSGKLNQPTVWSKVLTQSDVDKLWNNGDGIPYEQKAPDSPVDPIVLQYMPVLKMGEGEDYLPMGVDTFVESSALWDKKGKDTQLKNVDELSFGEFESIIGSSDTSDYYLAYSAPDTAKTMDLEAAKTKYDARNPETTVYYRKMVDGDYTVLQYWYFYAMNNWKEKGGFNNHEGDWESVFVYLDSSDETADPKYVGYSAHHNDGDPSDSLLQTGSVRRGWNSTEVTKEDGKPVSYVALGSHANYPNLNGGVYKTGTKDDLVSNNGTRLGTVDFANKTEIQSTTPFWMNYQGMWGADSVDILNGKSGPLGPVFNNVSGFKRFSDPVAWAGIDKIREVTISAPTKDIALEGTGVSMEFDGHIPVGTTFKVEPYDEWISFGQTEENVVFLPKFWDITSSLENGTFEAEVMFEYDPAVVEKLGGDEEDLKVFFYNEESQAWEIQKSDVDTDHRLVSFETKHFSRYALGFEQEDVSLDGLFETLISQISETSIRSTQKRHLLRYIKFIERFSKKEHKYAERITKKLLKRIEKRIKRHEKRGVISEQEKEEILETIDKIKKYLKNKDT